MLPPDILVRFPVVLEQTPTLICRRPTWFFDWRIWLRYIILEVSQLLFGKSSLLSLSVKPQQYLLH